MAQHLIKPDHEAQMLIDVTPETAGWRYLSFHVVKIEAKESHQINTDGVETALVPLYGSGVFKV
ncbi:MAG: 5-deoxy-glucuronate isomerase, partial [Ardenticatenaceae bacterium]|nr:5-deoxy-glucuronate isomerase [Ardenticatenaceae bacterium]